MEAFNLTRRWVPDTKSCIVHAKDGIAIQKFDSVGRKKKWVR